MTRLSLFVILVSMFAAVAASAAAPVTGTITPSAGTVYTGQKLQLVATFSDQDGAADIVESRILLNTALVSGNGVFLRIDLAADLIYLRNNGNTQWLGGFAPGSQNTVSNSQGIVYCADSSIQRAGNEVTVTIALELDPAIAGKTLYGWLYARDLSGGSDGWDHAASVVTAPPPPATGSLDPSDPSALAAGSRITLSASYSDGSGYGDITDAYLVINGTLSSKNAVSLRYDAANNKLYLRNDANTDWLGGYAPGSESSLIENSQCKIDCFETTVNGVSDTLAVNWRIEPKAALSGRELHSWMFARDATGATDGWDQSATYVVGAPDLNVSLFPLNANFTSNAEFSLSAIYQAPNGASTTSSYVLLNSSQGPANGIYLLYDGVDNKMWLRNDAGTAWTGGYAPESANTLENSYVTVDVARSRVQTLGSGIHVRWLAKLKPAAAGRKFYTWMYTSDTQGLADGWDLKGSVRAVAPSDGPENLGTQPVGALTPLNRPLVVSSGYAYADGVPNIVGCYLLLNTTLDANNCAYFYYDATNNKLWLRNDAGTAWLGGYAPGTENVIENSYVKLYCSTTTVTTAPTVNIGWSFVLNTSLAGKRLKAWTYVIDSQGKADGWDEFGEFLAEQITPALITTSRGQIALDLYDDEAPLTVANFKRLANLGFFNGLDIHRVESYVVQGGDGEPLGRLATPIPLEESLVRSWANIGHLGMARQDFPFIHTADSQFFINKQAQPGWDPTPFNYGYALFGAVTSGMDVVNATQVGDVINSVVILP